MNKKSKDFLIKHNLNIECIDKEKFIKDFCLEMKRGLNGKSSLKMNPTFVYESKNKSDKTFKLIVLDAGGTHLRGAIVEYNKGKIKVLKRKERKMIGVDKCVDKTQFYKQLKNFIVSLSKDELPISFCFSVECEMNENLDGKILSFGKLIKTKNVIGTQCVAELNEVFKRQLTMWIINDAIAANLGGQFICNQCGNYIGYILGTGTNISYYEDSINIKKKKCFLKKIKELINVESAGFDKFKISDFELELIKETDGIDFFEKTCGGVYFSKVLNKVFNSMEKEKLVELSDCLNFELKAYVDLFSKKDNNLGPFKNIKSYNNAKNIFNYMIMRIALLNALCLSSVIKFINSDETFYISLEGTTLKKLPNFIRHLKHFIKEQFPINKIKYVESENLNFLGAIKLACDRLF